MRGSSMADEVLPIPGDADSGADEPFEAELVAYLDGELDVEAAREVELRLASDPAARAKVAALRKTFDLLDYLPRHDPSPDFTTKTLNRLPVASGTHAGAGSAALISSSSPIVLSTGVLSLPVPASPPARPGWWAAGVLLVAAVCAIAGYWIASAMRPPPADRAEGGFDELPISDRGVVANLPLYAAVDDIEFARALTGPEYFGASPAVSFDSSLRPAEPVARDEPTGPEFEQLAAEFKALPEERRKAIRELDEQIRGIAGREERVRQLRVLEVYALWLDRLPAPERKSILAAASARRRLDEIRNVLERQWIESLPAAERDKLTGLSPADKAEVIAKWRREEAERREEWNFVREHAEDIAANRVPWPFDDTQRRQQVIEFVRAAFHTDNAKLSRLTANEFDRINQLLRVANEKQGWAWHAYGKLAYDLTQRYEYWLLPEPAKGDPITRPDQLPKIAERYVTGVGAKVVKHDEGKWPDFALAVNGLARGAKGSRLPPLGPARPRDFKEPLRSFVLKELMPALSSPERKLLESFEGRWPDYPREVLRLSKIHNRSAPGMMLPGPPRQWDALYRSRVAPARAVQEPRGEQP